jgi:hypothetical protein
LGIKLYQLTGDEIGRIKKDEIESNRFYSTRLPEFCLRDDRGTLTYTVDYLQWIESGEEKYYLFEAQTLDEILHEEIRNSGLESLLKDIDLRPFFKKLQVLTFNGLNRGTFINGQYLIISLSYIGGDMYNPDWDMEIDVEGVLTDKLEIIKIEENERGSN